MIEAASTDRQQPAAARAVARRHVFYLPGFDPRGVRLYYGTYRDEAARQAALGGYGIEVGARKRAWEHGFAWAVAGSFGEREVETTYEFLAWDDVVRANWAKGWRAIVASTFETYFYIVRTGAVVRVLSVSWPFFITMSLAVALLGGMILAGAAAASGLAGGIGLPWWAITAAALGGGFLAAMQAARIEPRTNAIWLGRTTAFGTYEARNMVPAYRARKRLFAERIAARAATGDVDEILVIGHSFGTETAMSVLAEALRIDPELPRRGAQLSLLTLGSLAPVIAYGPEAVSFRADIALLAATKDLAWIDVSAPPDGACFALVDPVIAAGAREATKPADIPKMISPRFMQILNPETYAVRRRDKMRLHFQYLMASEIPGDYDYFAITAGPLALGERFAKEKSRINFRRFALLSSRPKRSEEPGSGRD